MRQKVAQFLLDHKPQIQTLERAAILGAVAGAGDAATRGLTGESFYVAILVAVLRGCAPIVEGWLESAITPVSSETQAK